MAVGTIQKFIEILYDALVIGKSVSDDIQVSSDVNTARRIRKAIKERDLEKVRKEITKNQVLIESDDIIGIDTKTGGIIISADLAVFIRQVFKELRRARRRLKSKS